MTTLTLIVLFLCLCLVPGTGAFLQTLFGPTGILGGLNDMLGGIFGGGNSPLSGIFGSSQPQGPNATRPSTQPATQQPGVCQRRACVPYTVISTGPDYEHRRYEDLPVAVTSSPDFLGRMSLSFRLSGYVTGRKNADREKLNMTFPILTPAQNFSVMMYPLPRLNTPAPNNLRVRLDVLPAMEVFVRQFSGNASPSGYQAGVRAFQASLTTAGQVVTGEAFIAEYHSMFSLGNRHAEIWVERGYPIRAEQVGPQTEPPFYQQYQQYPNYYNF